MYKIPEKYTDEATREAYEEGYSIGYTKGHNAATGISVWDYVEPNDRFPNIEGWHCRVCGSKIDRKAMEETFGNRLPPFCSKCGRRVVSWEFFEEEIAKQTSTGVAPW